MRDAVEATLGGRLDAFPYLTHSFPVEELGTALDATRDRPDGFVKAVIAFQTHTLHA
jgi:NADPH:quinone reductase